MSDVENSAWLDAQYGCIGAALIDVKAVGTLMANSDSSMFCDAPQKIYIAMQAMFRAKKPIDPITLNDQTGGIYRDLIIQILDMTPSSANINHYINICKDTSVMVSLRNAMLLAATSGTMDEMREALDKANAVMVSRTSSKKPRDMKTLILNWYARKKQAANLVDLGDETLNKYIPAEQGDFIVIAADNSIGKTAFSVQLAISQAEHMRVGFYSLETSQYKILDRVIANKSDVELDTVKRCAISGGQWDKINTAANSLYEYSMLEIIPAGGWTAEDIYRDAVANQYEVIYIDYLQLIRSRDRDRVQAVTNISIRVHQMAQETGITTVALSQLHRMDVNKEPTKHDLRESGQIENDADIVLLIYEPIGKKKSPVYNRVVSIAKNKDGYCGQMKYHFDGAHMRFSKISERHVNMPLEDYYRMLRKEMAAEEDTEIKHQTKIQELPDDTEIPDEFEEQPNGGQHE